MAAAAEVNGAASIEAEQEGGNDATGRLLSILAACLDDESRRSKRAQRIAGAANESARRKRNDDRESALHMTDRHELVDRLAIIDIITRLFVYTDQGRWDDLAEHVLAATVDFDGGFGDPAGPRSGRDIADGWRTGLAELDAVHHQAGNHLIEIDGDNATAHADAIAVHVKNDAVNGRTRMFVGSYAIGLHHEDDAWRIDRFVYPLKVIDGNTDLT
jgi:hypothetical protein